MRGSHSRRALATADSGAIASAAMSVAEARVDVEGLLTKTSRTFALAIAFLPSPLRDEVGIAYLLFRIADTLEDTTAWPVAKRALALRRFEGLLASPGRGREAADAASDWASDAPSDHEGYRELLHAMPQIIALAHARPAKVRAALLLHVLRTSEGMRAFLARADAEGRLSLETIEDLQRYCYVVAGIVGELLTELFVIADPRLDALAARLSPLAPGFGEGLQLVNILKDETADVADGRRYMPGRASSALVHALARRGLAQAGEYISLLEAAGANRGILAFVGIPWRLAHAALDAIEQRGAGAKVTRERVAEIVASVLASLDAGTRIVGDTPSGSA